METTVKEDLCVVGKEHPQVFVGGLEDSPEKNSPSASPRDELAGREEEMSGKRWLKTSRDLGTKIDWKI